MNPPLRGALLFLYTFFGAGVARQFCGHTLFLLFVCLIACFRVFRLDGDGEGEDSGDSSGSSDVNEDSSDDDADDAALAAAAFKRKKRELLGSRGATSSGKGTSRAADVAGDISAPDLVEDLGAWSDEEWA